MPLTKPGSSISNLFVDATNPIGGLSPLQLGGLNDSVRLQAMIDYVGNNGGGTIALPKCQIKANIVISENNTRIIGQGTTGQSLDSAGAGGTIITPYSLTTPCIKIGDGTNPIYNIYMEDLQLVGDGTTTTSDGLHIIALYYGGFKNLTVRGFGGNNIYITSITDYPTSRVHFFNTVNSWARGYNLKVEFGPSWVTAVYFTGYQSNVGNDYAESKAMYLDCLISIFQGYCDFYAGHGIELHGAGAGIEGYGFQLDNTDLTGVVATTDVLSTVTGYKPFKGMPLGHGYQIQYGDTSPTVIKDLPNNAVDEPNFWYPVIYGTMTFAYDNGSLVDRYSEISKIYQDANNYLILKTYLDRIRLVPYNGIVEIRNDDDDGEYALLRISRGAYGANIGLVDLSSNTLGTSAGFDVGGLLTTGDKPVQVCGAVAAPATAGTMTVTFDALSSVITITPTGACTFDASGGYAGQRVTIIVVTSGVTSYTLTFGTNFVTTGTLATGTVTDKIFAVDFVCANGTTWVETGRTVAM